MNNDLERITLVTELILNGATPETIELAKDAEIEDLRVALELQKAITYRVSHTLEDNVSAQLAMRSRKHFD